MTSPRDPYRPDEGGRPDPDPAQQGHGPYGRTPYDDPAGALPHVYNPYGNVSYPSTYPTSPAGLEPGAEPLPARRPRVLHLALAMLLVSALPYVLFGVFALVGAADIVAAVPPEQLEPLRQAGVDPVQAVRSMGIVVLLVAAVFVLLAVLTWTGRRWALMLLTAMTVGFGLMLLVVVAAAGGQDAGSLLVPGVFLALAVIGVVLSFGSSARPWFARPRR